MIKKTLLSQRFVLNECKEELKADLSPLGFELDRELAAWNRTKHWNKWNDWNHWNALKC
jgi:hypothetical protein